MATNIKTALMLSLAFALGVIGVTANAADTNKGSGYGPNQAIMYLEKAKVEIIHNDFVPPSENLKRARAESEKITGDPKVVKKAASRIIQAQIKVKKGDIKGATDEMNKALELYQSIRPK